MSKKVEDSKQQAKKAAKQPKEAKKAKPAKDAKPAAKEEAKTALINDGKCCRCVWRHDKACTNTKSPKNGSYVARKCGCACFKYAK